MHGFRALAEFDKPDNGGTGNGMIDPGDAVWPRLLLWFDQNHNGISESGELVLLRDWNARHPTLAITGFDLHYKPGSFVGVSGNQFRFCALVFGPGAGRVTRRVPLVPGSPQGRH